MAEPVLVDGVRTPIGRAGGALRTARPDGLLARVIDGLLDRSGLEPGRIDDVLIGCVTQFGEQSGNVARLAALGSRLPASVPATTVNRACGSGQEAIHLAARTVAAGDARYLIAGGVESMSRVPMFADADGSGTAASRLAALDPGLLRRYELVSQGESAERLAARFQLSRSELDRYALESHRRAAAAERAGWTRPELLAVPGVDRAGGPMTLAGDEGIRAQPDLERMSRLAPVFRPDGVITAAHASQLSDGAALVLVADRATAVADGLAPIARFRARVAVGGDPTLQLDAVIPATRRALERARVSLSDLDVIEINEAFASVPLAWARELEPDLERVNPNGGAIAHGHPLGATGAVLMIKLLRALERVNGTLGLVVMCVARGMATATVVERL